MLAIDQYAMAKLIEIDKTVRDAYDSYKFSLVVSTLNNYCATYLSALYLDISKDRLYVEQADGILRRSVQTVLYHNLDTLARLMAPILSFLAEEVSDFYQKNKTESIHLQNFVSPTILQNYANEVPEGLIQTGVQSMAKPVFDAVVNLGDWALLEAVRDAVLKSIEPLREKGIVKHSLEAKVTLHINNLTDDGKQLLEFINKLAQKEDVIRFFKDWFIVSQVEFVHDNQNLGATDLDWLHVKIEHAQGNKCMRCWQWGVADDADQVVAAQLQAYQLCPRCCDILKK
jgi:isoleucyl-tRNA synthetase